MFIKHISRAGNPVGNAHSLTRLGAAAGAIALGAGLWLVAPVAANADDSAASFAQAQFLSGTLAGSDLANVVELAPAEARNNGDQPLQTSKDPLEATALQTVDVNAPNGVQLDLGDVVNAGAIGQYAEANRNGTSMGSSGAIGSDGAIGAGQGSGSRGNVDLDLQSAIGSQYGSALQNLKLSLEAISAQAIGDLTSATGDYTLDGATLTFTSPAIANLTPKVNSALGAVDTQLAGLDGSDGKLAVALDDVLNPLLAVTGSSANVSVNIDSQVQQAVDSLLKSQYGNDAVKFNLETGEVTVDLAALHGGDLNNLPVNTELLSDAVVNQVLKGITDTVSTLGDQIVQKATTALGDAKVNINADLALLTPQADSQSQTCHDVQAPILGDLGTGIGGVLGGLTGGSGQGVIGYTTQTICDLVNQALPDLNSTVKVGIDGTVNQLRDGTASNANIDLSLLNGTVQAPVNVTAVLDGLGSVLGDSLFGSGGAVSQLTDQLRTGLVAPAVTGLLGDNSVDTALTDALSVRVNLQELSLAGQHGMAVNTGQLFTQTAVRVTAGSGLATLNLAAATVGPNINTIVTPPTCTTNCGSGANSCVTGCTNGNPNPTGTAATRLAMTGVGIAALIAVVLALLAAGAYLAREGYRKTHPHTLS
ncbi:MAG: choice-of-anchor G family protein [Rhodoglobus sp.]